MITTRVRNILDCFCDVNGLPPVGGEPSAELLALLAPPQDGNPLGCADIRKPAAGIRCSHYADVKPLPWNDAGGNEVAGAHPRHQAS